MDLATAISRILGAEHSDRRVSDWLLMSSPWPTILLTAAYLLLVCKGPAFMRDRKPWNLQNFIVLYNLILVVLSLYMFLEVFIATVVNPKFNVLCSAVDYSEDEGSLKLLRALWWYYFSKCVEFIETIVFILRKKNSQITFLHVYHHSSMFLLWWLTVKHVGGGSSYFSALANTAVHCVMYTYYLLSALGDRVRKYLWWKRYLTSLQLGQFCAVIVHISFTWYSKCGYPSGYALLLVFYMLTQLMLFVDFFYKTYVSRSKITAVDARE